MTYEVEWTIIVVSKKGVEKMSYFEYRKKFVYAAQVFFAENRQNISDFTEAETLARNKYVFHCLRISEKYDKIHDETNSFFTEHRENLDVYEKKVNLMIDKYSKNVREISKRYQDSIDEAKAVYDL